MNNRNDLPQLIQFNCEVLDQALRVIDAHEATTTADFSTSSGPHLRHIIEHYEAFTAGVAARSIDYDTRARDRSVEKSSVVARERVVAIQQQLQAINARQMKEPIAVHLRGGLGGEQNFISFSTAARELLFIASHATHHYALIQLHCHQQGIDLGADFGKAPGTLRHEKGA